MVAMEKKERRVKFWLDHMVMLIRGYWRSHTVHTIHDRHKKTELLIYHNHCVVYSNKSDTFLKHTACWHSMTMTVLVRWINN